MLSFKSVQFKLTVLLLGVVVIVSVVNSWHGMDATARALTTAAETELSSSVESDLRRLEGRIRLVGSDLEIVLETPPLPGLLRAIDGQGKDPLDASTTEQWMARMEMIFRGVLHARPRYSRVSLVLADGEELAAMMQGPTEPIVVPKAERRNRGDAAWFKVGMQLRPKEVHVSELALLRDARGEVIQPHQAALSCFMPIYKDDKIRGLLVVDVLAQKLLEELSDKNHADKKTFLVNRDGTYYFNADARKEWGADLGHAENFGKDFPEAAAAVLSGQSGVRRDRGNFLAYRAIHPRPGDRDRFWVEVQEVPEQVVLSEVSRFRSIALILLFTTILATTSIGMTLTSRMISRPLRETVAVLEKIAAGDLTQQVRVGAGDEIGRMGVALNRAIEALRDARESERRQIERERQQAEELRRKVESILEVVNAASKGDLTLPMPVRGADSIGRMGEGLAAFLAQLRGSVGKIATTARTLTTSSSALTQISQQMASNTEETAIQAGVASAAAEQVSTNITTVSTAAEEMGASIKEIAKSTNEAVKVATTAVKLAQKTNAIVAKLGSSSIEIGNVVKVITSIAQQTNLLALNASIEAARAGEAGKGFAVVANAVKELAQQTAKATQDISHKIEAIQTDTQGAVGAIDQIGAIIHQINDIQGAIACAVEEQTATTAEIGRNVSEGARASTQIAINITGVAKAAQDTSQGAAGTRTAAESLAQLAIELGAMVGEFKY